MARSVRVYMSFILMLLAALACDVNAGPPPDPGAMGTSIAQTIIASLTVNAPASATSTPQPPVIQPTFTLVTDTPTLTPTQTLTATPSLTFTPLIAQIRVSVATNCRSGPGKAYPRVGALMTGEVAQVYARDPSGDYWYIRNPDNHNGFCWVWDEYATLTGSIATLPIFTPPATPTPTRTLTPTATFTVSPGANFSVGYAGLETCKTKKRWWVEFAVKNTGNVGFRSMTVVVLDIKKNLTLSRSLDGFSSVNGCNSTAHLDALWPGKSTIISSQGFPNNLKGRSLRARIVLCVQPKQGGVCVQKVLNLTP